MSLAVRGRVTRSLHILACEERSDVVRAAGSKAHGARATTRSTARFGSTRFVLTLRLVGWLMRFAVALASASVACSVSLDGASSSESSARSLGSGSALAAALRDVASCSGYDAIVEGLFQAGGDQEDDDAAPSAGLERRMISFERTLLRARGSSGWSSGSTYLVVSWGLHGPLGARAPPRA